MTILLIVLAAIAAAAAIGWSMRRVLAARVEAERVRTIFSRYVSPVVVDEILERHDPRVFAGRSGYATILVCRIWNFALFAEKLDAPEMIRYLNEFYTLVGKTIQKHRGMIDKFMNDGMSGAFGFPLEDPLQEEHAIRAALDIIRLVDAMNARWVAQGRQPFRVGIGINSGQVIAGDVGFAQRREYSVTGLPAIVASRLQEQTDIVHAYVLVTHATLEPVKHIFSTVPCKTIPLRGMKGNVRAYIIRGLARVEEDNLGLPAANSFTKTSIAEDAEDFWTDPPPEATPEPAPATPPVARPTAPRPSSKSNDPPSPPEPPRIAARRPRPLQQPQPEKKMNMPPEAKGFGHVDNSPAMPDPPVTQEFYEDDSGRPPLKLPP